MANLTFNCVKLKTKAEVVVENSRFIAIIKQIESEADAKAFLEELKKEYPNARHICFAYSVFNPKNKVRIDKKSDNGEPEGTAGTPILNTIKNNNLGNVILVVVRIFGGTLLGTGLLTRSYAQASEKVVKNSNLISVAYMGIFEIVVTYAEAKKVLDFFEGESIKVLETEYEEDVVVSFACLDSDLKKIHESLNKVLNKKVAIKKIDQRFV